MTQRILLRLFLVTAFLAFSGCQKAQKARILASVMLVSGKITVNGAAAKAGDPIQENALIVVEDASRCELIVKLADATAQLKIIGPSELKLNADDLKKVGSVEMRIGKALFEVEHLKGGRFSVVSPVAIASVRGTEFTVNVGVNGDTKIFVHEGTVGYRVRSEAVEDLPDKLKQSSKVISGMVQALNASEAPIVAGSAVTVTRERADGIINRVPGLRAALQSETTKDYLNAERTGSADPTSTIRAIDGVITNPDAEAAFKKNIGEIRESANTLRPQKMDEDEKQKDMRDFDNGTKPGAAPLTQAPAAANTSLAQKEQEYNQLIARKGSAVTINEISQVMGKQGESVKLKSGVILQGVLYQEGDHYLLFTSTGKRVIQESELAEVKF